MKRCFFIIISFALLFASCTTKYVPINSIPPVTATMKRAIAFVAVCKPDNPNLIRLNGTGFFVGLRMTKDMVRICFVTSKHVIRKPNSKELYEKISLRTQFSNLTIAYTKPFDLIENKTVFPGLTLVGDGFISLIGYQAQGYHLVPVF